MRGPSLVVVAGAVGDRPSVARPRTPFSTVEEALEEIRAGRMVVVCDDEDRQNEGDLTMAAELVTSDAVNFMAKEGRGLVSLALAGARCDRLALAPMTPDNALPFGTAFTVSIEAATGVTTGISAADRARTIRVAVDPSSDPRDLVRPGHVFPLRARPGGVLERPGHTEAAVDLARLAGLAPAGVICQVMNDDGTMARVPDLVGFCARHGIKRVTIADLVAYRRRHDPLVERVVTTALPTAFGAFDAVGYRALHDGREHLALVKGELDGSDDVFVRVHEACTAGDVFHSLDCSCGAHVDAALAAIEAEGRGVLLYLARDVCAAAGAADARGHDVGAQILIDLGVRSLRILADDPAWIATLEGHGLAIVEQASLEAVAS